MIIKPPILKHSDTFLSDSLDSFTLESIKWKFWGTEKKTVILIIYVSRDSNRFNDQVLLLIKCLNNKMVCISNLKSKILREIFSFVLYYELIFENPPICKRKCSVKWSLREK